MRAQNHWGSEWQDSTTGATSRSCDKETLGSLFSRVGSREAAVLFLAATVSVGSLAEEVSGQTSTAQKETSAVGAWLSFDKEPLEAEPLPESGTPPRNGPSPRAGTAPRVGAPLEAGEDRRSVTAQTSMRSQGSSATLSPLPAASGQTEVASPVAGSWASEKRSSAPAQLASPPFTPVPEAAPTVKLQRVRLAPFQMQPIEPAPSPRTAGPLYMGAPPRIGPPPELVARPGTGALPENKAGELD